MQEEVTQKTIALSMKTGKLTAQALQAALKKYLQHRAKGPKLHHGKQSLKQLKAHGAALTNIEVTEANIGAFKPCAKKYGVDFTLRKDKTTQPPHYIVIFKAKDTDNLEQAFREFTAKTLSKEQYLFAKCGQAYRLAAGVDASAKLLHLTGGISAALANPLPSLHLFDLCVGVAGAVAVRLIVYSKGKNAKKYRKGEEYGSARWSA